jgi:hypothetical protein
LKKSALVISAAEAAAGKAMLPAIGAAKDSKMAMRRRISLAPAVAA